MYNVYRVELKMHDKLVGSLPLNTEALSNYIKAKFPEGEDDTEEFVGKDLELDEEKEKSMTGFKKDETWDLRRWLPDQGDVGRIGQSLQEITVKKRGSKNTLREGLVVLGLDD